MAAVTQNEPVFIPYMKGPIFSSLLLHAIILIIAIVGLPYIKPELPEVHEPIAVELVKVDEVTQVNKPPPEKPAHKPKPEQRNEQPPRPVQPQVTAERPPKPVPPKPPEPEQKENTLPDPEPSATMTKPEEAKPVTPPKPVKRPETPARDEATPQQQEDFKSLLRNLMPAEKQQAVETKEPGESQKSSMLTQFSQQMTVSELQALRQQLTQCWSLMAGARYAEHLIVDIKLFMNPDRTVRDAQIQNRIRYNTDSYFRAAADSALRAVYRCSPLDLPPNKYDLWETITVTFDPRTML